MSFNEARLLHGLIMEGGMDTQRVRLDQKRQGVLLYVQKSGLIVPNQSQTLVRAAEAAWTKSKDNDGPNPSWFITTDDNTFPDGSVIWRHVSRYVVTPTYPEGTRFPNPEFQKVDDLEIFRRTLLGFYLVARQLRKKGYVCGLNGTLLPREVAVRKQTGSNQLSTKSLVTLAS